MTVFIGYTWHPPLVVTGALVIFRARGGRDRAGVVEAVRTIYDATGKARHLYGMRPEKSNTLQWVGDDAFTGVKRAG